MNKEIKLKNVKIKDEFWSKRQELVLNTVLPYQEKILNDEIEGVAKSHALANFRIAAGLEEGEFYGMVFQDSDVAKWLEGAAYSLTVKPDADLEKRIDEIIEIIGKAQQEDGYLNTYFTIKEPEHRWQDLQECHELYCAGHMMEAGVAYYEATGKTSLLKIMERMADHIAERFGPGKQTGIPGHQEVEIGLMRMYKATGNAKYRDLARYFIDERGKNPDIFVEEAKKRGWKHFPEIRPDDKKYYQIFAPVREQKTAEGHAVRAVYMYTAMADIAGSTGDQELIAACDTLWDNITKKRMYITGGIGSTVEGEAFSIDYDLPNDTMYCETCASVGMAFFAKKMLDIRPSNKYADILEKELYNGILSGMQLDGKRFFYVNPLEVNPGVSGELFGYKHVLPERPGWYECACCPPNVVRFIMSLGKYVWSEKENVIFSHVFIGNDADFDQAHILVESDFPWEGKVKYVVNPKKENTKFTLAIRIPSYAKNAKIALNGTALEKYEMKEGYLYLHRVWSTGDEIEIIFDMPVERIYANTNVRANAGCAAIKRGPIVYAIEGMDNGERLQEIRIPRSSSFEVKPSAEEMFKGMKLIEFAGKRETLVRDELYTSEEPEVKDVRIKAIPYFAWGNRGINQMRVWIREKE